MLKFNRDRVKKITSEILMALERLEDLKRLPLRDFLSDPREFNKSPIMWCKKWSVRGVYGVILLAGDKLWGGDEFLRFYLVLWEADD